MPDALFNVLVAGAFLAALGDHYFAGQGRIVKPLRALLLGLFIATESAVALDGRPLYFLYVLLNVWGLYFLFMHRWPR